MHLRRKLIDACLLTLVLVGFHLVTASWSVAQVEDPDPPAPSRANCTVAGSVLNSLTGEPIRRALVQISNLPTSPLTVMTDSEGHFQFPDLPEADVVLAVRKPGFFSDQELHPDTVRAVTFLHVDANTPALVLKLVPEGAIAGHLATAQGEPVEDAPVQAFQQRVIDGRKRWEQRGQTTTDDEGEFRIANLAPGQYLLSVGPAFGLSRNRVSRSRTRREEQICRSFYPGVPEFDAATRILVSAGQRVQADFLLKPEPLFKVSGAVVGSAPGSGNAPQFLTRDGEPLSAPVTFDGLTGKFEAQIPAGSYLLQLRTPVSPNGLLGTDLPLAVTSDTANVTVPLGSPLVIPVHVEVRSTANAPNPNPLDAGPIAFERLGPASLVPRVEISQVRIPQVQVRLMSSEAHLVPQEFQADNDVADRSFAVRNFSPGKYFVDLQPNPPWYVQSATSGTTDLLREELVITPGHHPDPIDIVLHDDGATVSGSVRVEGQPAAGAVLLFPEQGSMTQVRLAQAAPGGEFIFDRVPPGEYKLLAFDSVESVEFRNPLVMASYLSKAAQVTLRPNEQANLTVEEISVEK